MIDIDRLLEKGQKIADEIEVFVTNRDNLSLEQREMAVSSVSETTEERIYIRVIKDKKMGVSATSDPTRIEECLNSALSSAKLSAEISGWSGFARKVAVPAGKDPYDNTLEISPDAAAEYLKRMNDGAKEHPEARVVTGGVGLSRGSSTIANSNGVWLERKTTEIELGMDAICEGSTGYDTDGSPFASRLNPEKIGERTTYFASASRNGKAISSGKYDVVFSEDVVDSLILNLFMDAIDGKNVLTGQSIYAGKLGESVASESLSIIDDPMNSNGGAFRRFDTEGTPAKTTEILKNGVLNTYLYDAKTAGQAGVSTTGHAHRSLNGTTLIGPHCLTIAAPEENVLQKPCMYIKEVIGAHTANPLTGEFSVEVANAFLAENGKFIDPVKKAMIAGNVFDILKNGVTISHERKAMQGALVPLMRINDLQVI